MPSLCPGIPVSDKANSPFRLQIVRHTDTPARRIRRRSNCMALPIPLLRYWGSVPSPINPATLPRNTVIYSRPVDHSGSPAAGARESVQCLQRELHPPMPARQTWNPKCIQKHLFPLQEQGHSRLVSFVVQPGESYPIQLVDVRCHGGRLFKDRKSMSNQSLSEIGRLRILAGPPGKEWSVAPPKPFNRFIDR